MSNPRRAAENTVNVRSRQMLVTGATGTVGGEVLRLLSAARVPVRAAVRSPDKAQLPPGAEAVRFDFHDASTFSAFEGVKSVFLMRPPDLANARRDLGPAIDAMKAAGVEQVVFLSLMGAERNPLLPHRAIEKLLLASGLTWVFLRPSFFMQNLSTTHAEDIRERHDVFVPAGHGRTSLIDARDIAVVAALAMLEGHRDVAYPLTGDEALTYDEVALKLSLILNERITYSDPSIWAFYTAWRERGANVAYVLIMVAIYTTAKLGLAAEVTPDTRRLLGRPATTFWQFAHDERAAWLPENSSQS